MTPPDNPACPERDRLVQFLLGHLPEPELETLEQHLSDCAACGDTLQALNAEDTLVQLTRSAQPALPEADLVDDLIPRVQQLLSDPTSAIDPATGPARDERAEGIRRLLRPTEEPDELGRLATYRVLDHLGTGATGVVFEAQDEQLERTVALKILRPSLGQAARARFLQEARAAAAIDHENVVTIYQVGEDHGLAFLAMQRLDGETLETLIKREGTLPTDQILDIGRQLALGLRAAHAENLIHRDVKPANIWVETGRNRAKILDFGLARVLDDGPQLTESGMIAGTPAYMSPEQARGQGVDERSDLFSLGCVLYRLATGQLPFQGANALATLRAIEKRHPEPPQSLNPDVPQPLADLVMWLLEKAPNHRPQSADAVAEALQRIAENDPQLTVSRQHRTSRARTAWRWAVGLVAVLLLGVPGYFTAPTIIRIVTNQGQLVIETDDPNIKVEILQDGEVVRVVDLQSEQSIDLTAGAYGLQLADADADWSLSTDRVILTRGGKKIVEVRHELTGSPRVGTDLAQSPSPAPDAPTYEGKTLDQWLAELETERSPDRLARTVGALAALADEASATRAAGAVFSLMRDYSSVVIDSSPRGQFIKASQHAMWQMPADAVIPAMLKEMTDGNHCSREFMIWMAVEPGVEDFSDVQPVADLRREMKRRAGEIMSTVLALSRGDSGSTRGWAIRFACEFCNTYEIDPAQIEGLIPRLQEELSNPDTATMVLVLHVLVTSAPDTEGLVDTLIGLLSDKSLKYHYATIRSLGLLGPRAAPAVPTLASLLAEWANGPPNTLWRPDFGTPFHGPNRGQAGLPALRVLITQTLGDIGPGAVAALPLLEKIASMDPAAPGDMDFQLKAKEAIAKIKGIVPHDPVADPMFTPPAAAGVAKESSRASRPPTYDGKTLAEWFIDLETERNPENLAKAVRALTTLTDEALAGKAARIIFPLMRTHGSLAIDDGPRGKLVNASRQALWQLPADAVIPAMVEEISGGTDNSREFMTWMAVRPSLDTGYDMQRAGALAREMKKRAGEITSAALALLRDDSVPTRKWALGFVVQFCHTHGIDPTEIDGLIPRFQEELTRGEVSTTLAVSGTLVRSAPDTAGLVDVLADVLSDENAKNQYSALENLRQLGPRAAPAVPKLVDLLTKLLDPSQKYLPLSWGLGGAPDLRVETITTLGAIGPGAVAALPLLEDIVSADPAKTGRTDFDAYAKEAIAKIKATGGDEEKIVEAPREPSEPAPSVSGPAKAPSPAPQVPTYDGKTLDQWYIELETERNLERLAEAVRATAACTDEASAEKSARAIFSLMRTHGSMGGDGAPRGQLVDPAQRALCQMPADGVIAAMLEEVANGNDKSREFVSWLYLILTADTSPGMRQMQGTEAMAREMKNRAAEIASTALALSRHDSVSRRKAALEFAWHCARLSETGPAKIDGFIERFEEELSYRDPSTIPLAVSTLIEHAPDAEGLVDSLIHALSDEDPTTLLGTVHCLQNLGPRAAAAVPKLMNLLTEYMKPPPKQGTQLRGRPRWSVWRIGGGMLPDLRVEIIQALGAIGPDAAAALPLLEKITSMKPAETGGADLNVKAKEAIAKIGATGGDEEMSVEVAQEPSEPAPSVSGPAKALTYEGKTFDQWFGELETERSAESLVQAVLALDAMSDEASAGKFARAIFSLMRTHFSLTFGDTPGGKLIVASKDAIWRMPAEAVTAAMLEEFNGGNHRSCEFMSGLVGAPVYPVHPGQDLQRAEDFAHELKQHADEITSAALALSRDDSVSTRRSALSFLLQFCSANKIDPSDIDGLIPRCQEELSSRDVATVLVVSSVLVGSAPDTEGLVDALADVLADKDVQYHYSAIRNLRRLGPRAAPAVPKLVQLLTESFEGPPQDFNRYLSRYGPHGWDPTETSVAGGGMTDKADPRVDIIHTLGAIGPAAAAALPLLERIGSMIGGAPGCHVPAQKAIAKIKATGGDSDPK